VVAGVKPPSESRASLRTKDAKPPASDPLANSWSACASGTNIPSTARTASSPSGPSPHSNAACNIDDQLVGALVIETPVDEREKPACCDEEGTPPIDVEAAEANADVVQSPLTRARRRR